MSAAFTEKTETTSVLEYLGTLVWDGTPRIDRWLVDCAGAEDSSYVRAASRAILVAAVRRARHPGCRFDQMPIFNGPQGCGKSAALRLLAVEDEWFTDTLPLLDGDSRQIIEATAGKWIIGACEIQDLFPAVADELDENDDKNEEEAVDDDRLSPTAALKSFLSRSVDEARMPYQRERSRVPRQFVVVGTTNATPYLTDPTGNRRIWPIRVGRFDLGRLAEARDQLWAEAAVAEATGESIDLVAAAPSA